MYNLSVLTGLDKRADGYQSPLKKMCLNCVSCTLSQDDGPVSCINPTVLEAGKKKVLESLDGQDFVVGNVEIKAMTLKDPTKKCKQYAVNRAVIDDELNEIFG